MISSGSSNKLIPGHISAATVALFELYLNPGALAETEVEVNVAAFLYITLGEGPTSACNLNLCDLGSLGKKQVRPNVVLIALKVNRQSIRRFPVTIGHAGI